MRAERIHNEFTYSDTIYLEMTPDEFNTLRFDISMAIGHKPDRLNYDAFEWFLDETNML